MAQLTSNPVTVIGAGADSMNQVVRRQVLALYHECYDPYYGYNPPVFFVIEGTSDQALRLAADKLVVQYPDEKDLTYEFLISIPRTISGDWQKFSERFENYLLELVDGVEIEGVLFVSI